ncbi:hypothetical protein ACULNC_15045 [Shigella flexneri]
MRSSQLTLNVMTWVAVVLVPIILLYTAAVLLEMFRSYHQRRY